VFTADFTSPHPFSQIPGVDWNQLCETLLLAAAVLACRERECLPEELFCVAKYAGGRNWGEKKRNKNSRSMRKLLALKRI